MAICVVNWCRDDERCPCGIFPFLGGDQIGARAYDTHTIFHAFVYKEAVVAGKVI